MRNVRTSAKDEGGRITPPRAVAYVRMSTDHQKYSTENQLAVIRRYAEARALEVVRTYADAGKSGLRLDGRDALQNLMQVVKSGQADFAFILVYDVSRWGRFQDADEGAYYEHECARAGITIHYCAEQFENDGSIGSSLLKTVKRVMAGEYSRELSVKVFAGQCRLVELGFRQGGTPGFGLRRLLIDEARTPKGTLSFGERKSLQTDRVILVPGPPQEVEIVRHIYRSFVERSIREREIAEELNKKNKPTDLGRQWTRATVHQVLTNEKYVGNNVYNRISFKLKRQRVANAPDMWVRSNGVFEPLVDADVFERARAIIEERSRKFSDEDLLELLRKLLENQGALSGLIIDERDDMPSSSVYRSRFGSLLRAYKLVGFTPDRDYRYLETNRMLRRMHPEVVADVVDGLQRAGGNVERSRYNDLITINSEFTASVVIARARFTSAGAIRWQIRLDAGLLPDVTVAIRLDAENRKPYDYYLLPSIDMSSPRLRLAERNGLSLDAYRFDTLDFFYGLAARSQFAQVA
jgi:DNA invertase Pin-like site-specific DNA recombinase